MALMLLQCRRSDINTLFPALARDLRERAPRPKRYWILRLARAIVKRKLGSWRRRWAAPPLPFGVERLRPDAK